jgi:hypothetical protein
MLYSSELQRQSEGAALVGLEPTTVGSEVTPAFTTPQTSFCKLLSLVNLSIAFRARSFRSDTSTCHPKRALPQRKAPAVKPFLRAHP